MKKVILSFVVLATIVFCFSACKNAKSTSAKGDALMTYDGKTIAVPTGAIGNITVKNKLMKADVVNYDNVEQCVEALIQGQVDGVAFDRIVLENFVHTNDTLTIVDEPITSDKYAYAVNKGRLDLLVEINMALANIKSSGIYDEAVARLTNGQQNVDMPHIPNDGGNGVLTFACSTDVAPCSYKDGEDMKGLDVEIAYRIGAFLGKKVELVEMNNTNYDEFLRNIKTGRADVIAGLFTITYDRKSDLDFTKTIMEGDTVLLVKKQMGA